MYERHVAPVLHDFAGAPFEMICREWLWRESMAGRLPFHAAEIGRWWNRTSEIDVMAVDGSGEQAIMGECKFRSTPMSVSMLNLLRDRAASTGIERRSYVLFSLDGFDGSLAELVEHDQDLWLVDIDRLMAEE